MLAIIHFLDIAVIVVDFHNTKDQDQYNADKRRSLGLYSSLADYSHGVS
jgi:hypothetical protein